MNKAIYKNISTFHPGYYIQDLIEEMEITQNEFAKRLNTTGKTLSKLLNGEIPLSNDLAENLSLMLGTSVNVWINLQKKYEEKCCEIERIKKIDKEKKYLKLLDYNYFSNLGVVSSVKDENQRIVELCTALKISSLSVLEQPDLLTACKTSILDVKPKNVVNANAWIQLGVNFARKVKCNEYSQASLIDTLPKLRSLTRESLTSSFKTIEKLLADCGVVLIALPYLKNSGLNGAVKWLNKDKAMLLINDRKKDVALFWFTLFHELKHILRKRIKAVYLTPIDKKNQSILFLGRNDKDEEIEADEFARNQLIPQEEYLKFIQQNSFSLSSIQNFADKIGILRDIVIGRLQHDKNLDWSKFSHFQSKYCFSKNE